jgi:hypothetical protein
MVSVHPNYAVGQFSNSAVMESALRELNRFGFSVTQISMTDRADSNSAIDFTRASDGVENEILAEITFGAAVGSIFGAIAGYLIGLGVIVVPGVGLLVAVGTMSATVTTTVASTGIGAVSGSLIRRLLMTPEQIAAPVSADRSASGEYLLVVDGTPDEVRRARPILDRFCFGKVWLC